MKYIFFIILFSSILCNEISHSYLRKGNSTEINKGFKNVPTIEIGGVDAYKSGGKSVAEGTITYSGKCIDSMPMACYFAKDQDIDSEPIDGTAIFINCDKGNEIKIESDSSDANYFSCTTTDLIQVSFSSKAVLPMKLSTIIIIVVVVVIVVIALCILCCCCCCCRRK